MSDERKIGRKGVDRRTVIAGGLGALAAPAVLRVIPANAQSKAIKIGMVSPKTGPLAGFGEADAFVIDQVNKLLKPGIAIGGKTYPVEIIQKDSQSTSTRASENRRRMALVPSLEPSETITTCNLSAG